jgi:ubiquinone/menaquinone biosynthesis C-methylase UbiE
LGFPDESFDAVLALHVLDAVADQRRALAELYRVLRRRGSAVLQVPVDHQPRLAASLAEVGFETTALPAAALGAVAAARHGLILEEATYLASKP